MSRPPSWAPICLGIVLVLQGVAAWAQLAPRPAEERPELPEFEPPERPPRVLPPVELPEEEGLRGVPLLYVREFRIEGNTAFDDEELLALLTPWVGREIASEDLVAIRNTLTRHYIEAGYVNSGAVFPDQDPRDGVILVRIIEGRLAVVEFEGNRFYRDIALRWRIAEGLGVPLDEREVEERLQRLVEDRRIERVRARLLPGEALGEGRLLVRLEERLPLRGFAEASNHATVGVGSERGRLFAQHENLLGMGDTLSARYDVAKGLDRIRGRYELPFAPWGMRARMQAEYSSSEIVDGDFRNLDIDGEYQGYEGGLYQPFYPARGWTLGVALMGGYRKSEIDLSGDPLGQDEEIKLLRLDAEAVYRGRDHVFAARSLLTQGLDLQGGENLSVLSEDAMARQFGGARDTPPRVERNSTTSWLLQLQWVSRFGSWGLESVARTDLQLSADPLLAIEQLALGGRNTVRGYRENEIIRDQGVISSLELRVPLWRAGDGVSSLKLAPFVDVAHGWNHEDSPRKTRTDTLVGLGVGLRLRLTRYLRGEIYWGQNLTGSRADDELQDKGVLFRVAVGLF